MKWKEARKRMDGWIEVGMHTILLGTPASALRIC
jgi:hypothetical protein